jgi:hypothetical protein
VCDWRLRQGRREAFIETLDVLAVATMGNGQRPDLGFADIRRKDSIGSRAEIKGMESLIPSNIYSILVTMIYVCELLIQRQGAQSGNRWM